MSKENEASSNNDKDKKEDDERSEYLGFKKLRKNKAHLIANISGNQMAENNTI